MYKLNGFLPPMQFDNRLNAFSFSIDLDSDFARAVASVKLPSNMDRFNKLIKLALRRLNMDDVASRPVMFYNDTCLATNFTVAGNACGIDVEWGIIGSIVDNENYQPRYLTYLPHNIDSLTQAYALVSIFSFWYEIAESLIYDHTGILP